MWLCSFASNIGTWMQTVVLPAYIDGRTESGTMVGLFTFAQLGPLLLLSIPGGVLAERFHRKLWIGSMQLAAMVLTVAMAGIVHVDGSVWLLLLVQLLTGVSNAFNAPAQQGVVPALVDKDDLAGAVSLNSVMINGSRVLGPVLAALLIATTGISLAGLLLVNAASYVFMLLALKLVPFPHIDRATDAQGWANFTMGVRIARHRTVLARCLITMTVFSFVSLAFVGLFATITRLNFGLNAAGSTTYKWLYATWGVGAMLGALAVGTVLARFDPKRMMPPLLLAFAACLTAFSLLRSITPAFPVGFALGFFYFSWTTCVMTVFQQNLRNSERARVMSLWFMSFGGTVAVGNLAFGPVMDAIGATPVLLLGAAASVWLAWYSDLIRRPARTLADDERDESDYRLISA
jgi:MFS family permease